jgi:hypothetical protein
MKRILAALAAGLMIGGVAASYAKLPPAPPKTDEQKAGEAQKAAADKAKEADLLNRAQDKAVANYKKRNPASMDRKK